MEKYDVIVVGGSFAGLSFAEAAALKGLNVLVLEKDKAFGKTIRTTGIFFDEVLNNLNIPNELLINRISNVYWYFANKTPVKISRKFNRFYMTDTQGVIKFMAKEAKTAGATLLPHTTFTDAKVTKKKDVIVKAKGDKKDLQFKCRFVIGADGAKSKVAEAFNLDRNTKFLIGTEKILAGKKLASDTFHCLLDYNIAPGYLAWLAPHGENIAIGLAGHLEKVNMQNSPEKTEKFFNKIVPLDKLKLIEQKAGLIPIGGILKKIYNEHALLIGDAGGFCGPLTAGGIYSAVVTGQIAAIQVTKMLETEDKTVLKEFIRQTNTQYNLIRFLNIEKVVRSIFDALDSNKEIQNLGEILSSSGGKFFLKKIFLKTYIPELTGKQLLSEFLKVITKMKVSQNSIQFLKNLLDNQ